MSRRVSYFFEHRVGNFHYGPGHPMKPHRMTLTHNLVVNYGLWRQMKVFRPRAATKDELLQFHADDYVDFLLRVTPDNAHQFAHQFARFNVGDDCPIFDGLGNFCSLYAGGSIEGARKLNSGDFDICINWSGGLHHAKKFEASGFCFVNDINLAIIELLRYIEQMKPSPDPLTPETIPFTPCPLSLSLSLSSSYSSYSYSFFLPALQFSIFNSSSFFSLLLFGAGTIPVFCILILMFTMETVFRRPFIPRTGYSPSPFTSSVTISSRELGISVRSGSKAAR